MKVQKTSKFTFVPRGKCPGERPAGLPPWEPCKIRCPHIVGVVEWWGCDDCPHPSHKFAQPNCFGLKRCRGRAGNIRLLACGAYHYVPLREWSKLPPQLRG